MSERNAELVRRFWDGVPVSALAQEHGISRQRVYQVLEAEGRRAGGKPSVARAEAAAQEVIRAAGSVSITEAANRHKTGTQTVARELANLGFDYQAARTRHRLKMHQARAEGEGEVTCSVCGEVKPWAEMARAKTGDGLPTRRRTCQNCSNIQSSESHRRHKL